MKSPLYCVYYTKNIPEKCKERKAHTQMHMTQSTNSKVTLNYDKALRKINNMFGTLAIQHNNLKYIGNCT